MKWYDIVFLVFIIGILSGIPVFAASSDQTGTGDLSGMIEVFVEIPDEKISQGIANAPQDFGFSPDGILFISGIENNIVWAFEKNATGAMVHQPEKDITEGLEGPLGITFDKEGLLYISNFNGDTINIYQKGSDGKYSILSDRTIKTGNVGPQGLLIRSDGTLFVVCFNEEQIHAYKKQPDGTFEQDHNLTITESISVPIHATFDREGTLYVNNWGPSTITAYLPQKDGTYKLDPEKTITIGLDEPYGIFIDKDDTLYVANIVSPMVPVYRKDSTGKYVPVVEETITEGLSQPISITMDDAGKLYILNYDNYASVFEKKEVKKSSIAPVTLKDMSIYSKQIPDHPAGDLTTLTMKVPVYMINETKTITTHIDQPQDLTADSKDRLYLGNFGTDEVVVFEPDDIGRYTQNPDLTITSVHGPGGVQVHDDILYVTNYYNNSVTAYKPDADGNFANEPFMTTSGGMVGPFTTTVSDDGQKLFSPNYNDDSVTFFTKDADGNFVFEPGLNLTSKFLAAPTNLKFDPETKTGYITNMGNGVITAMVMKDGRYEIDIDQSISAYNLAGASGNTGPFKIRFGPDGNMYIANYNGNMVTIFVKNTDGYYLLDEPKTIRGIKTPITMTFDSKGNLYIASFYDDAIYVYEPTFPV